MSELTGEPTDRPDPVGRASKWPARMLRWLTLLSLIAVAAIGPVLYLALQPTEMEQEIRLDLISRGKIGKSARVRVLDDVRLVTFHRRPYRSSFATICIRDGSQLYLALARCPRIGAAWGSRAEDWLAVKSWPGAKQVQEFKKQRADQMLPALMLGYLPRPASKADYQVQQLSIQASEAIDGFDPNEGIDQALLADILKREVEYTGQFHLNQFSFAPFHKPRWISPAVGIAETQEYIDFLQRHKGRRELAHGPCEPLIETLETVVRQLRRLENRNLKFYLLARDSRSD